jgi:hypothetical protein
MKTGLIITLSMSTVLAFIGTYFFNLTADNAEQFSSSRIGCLC